MTQEEEREREMSEKKRKKREDQKMEIKSYEMFVGFSVSSTQKCVRRV